VLLSIGCTIVASVFGATTWQKRVAAKACDDKKTMPPHEGGAAAQVWSANSLKEAREKLGPGCSAYVPSETHLPPFPATSSSGNAQPYCVEQATLREKIEYETERRKSTERRLERSPRVATMKTEQPAGGWAGEAVGTSSSKALPQPVCERRAPCYGKLGGARPVYRPVGATEEGATPETGARQCTSSNSTENAQAADEQHRGIDSLGSQGVLSQDDDSDDEAMYCDGPPLYLKFFIEQKEKAAQSKRERAATV